MKRSVLDNTTIAYSRVTHMYEVFVRGANVGNAPNYDEADAILRAARAKGVRG